MQTKLWSIATLMSLGLLSAMGVSQVANPEAHTLMMSPVAANDDSHGGSVQNGASFTDRPSADSGSPGYNSPAAAFDGNLTTASFSNLTQAIKGATSRIETWFGFPSTPPGASGMVLNISSSASVGRGGTASLSYSLNGGTTFTSIYFLETGSRSKQTDMISLSNTQDLTKIQVKAQDAAFSDGTFVSTADQSIYEIWVTGTD